MRKKILLIIIIILTVIILIPQDNDEFRIRVIANSNSVSDQNEKSVVVQALQNRIAHFNKSDIVNEITNNLAILDNDIKNALSHHNYSITISKVRFPVKEINGQVISGGKYRTLLVIIGKGEGKNWWSLLYPDYHGISFEDIDSGDVEYKFYFWEELKKLLLNS
ncbi:MAG: stage II sporulation protein R [Bacilli bacterium]|nr:stage II sporulation protein R [Bacilli bacterium]MDD4076477.1 stage II sporulation protein R [Bacilli bacterium]MDD4388133.1 stage II sporulation protein R [Bacilli bacterium]